MNLIEFKGHSDLERLNWNRIKLNRRSNFQLKLKVAYNNNKYISWALNPSVSNLHEAQSAVRVQLKLSKLHIQLKLSKQKTQQCQENMKKAGDGWVKGPGPNIR